MDRDDPVSQFFPDQEEVDLYSVLSLDKSTTSDAIKKAYHRLALIHHPDKHNTSSEEIRRDASIKFQQVGFAYAVLSDEKRRKRYDQTGRTDEGFELQAGGDGWDTYFTDLFDSVTRGKLDEMKKEYQGSAEEIEDIKRAYLETGGNIGEIMKHIPHSTFEDETRFTVLITKLIKDRELTTCKSWEKSVKDEKAKLARVSRGRKEATEAEELARELGVWDEFYGSGKTGSRKMKGKDKADVSQHEADVDEEDHSALQALILGKKKRMDGFLDSLASKYAEPEPKVRGKKGKKRAIEDDDDNQASGKRNKDAPPDIDDEEFEKLQQELLGDKTGKGKRETRAKSLRGAAKSRKGRKEK